jgi:hypothetical protein
MAEEHAIPKVHGLAHIGGGHYLGVVECERCHLNYTAALSVGYRYRPICPVCAEETGEQVQFPIEDKP